MPPLFRGRSESGGGELGISILPFLPQTCRILPRIAARTAEIRIESRQKTASLRQVGDRRFVIVAESGG